MPVPIFSNLVQIERVEDGLKTRKVKGCQTLFEQTSNDIRGSTKKTFPNIKNETSEKEVHFISSQAPSIDFLI